ncbi:MAG: MFS transporter [Gemmatimonadetes bacterium]|nr:MFS transporter [Gemmatimonadota bacterium]
MRETVRFLKGNVRFLAFGFALTFFSSFGQTFFLSLFAGEIREQFSLSHGTWGLVYSLATLASGLTVGRLGAGIDRMSLPRYTALVCGALVVSAFGFAAVTSIATLAIAVFAMRLTGQGLMGHVAMTSMARYFERERGRAISIALLGFPVGEATLPPLAVGLKATLGWRGTWLLVGGALAIVLVPLALALLRGHDRRHEEWAARAAAPASARDGAATARDWTRAEVLRDPRFWLVLPAAVTCGFLLTGLFFHQVHLTEAKGWSLEWYALGFSGFAVSQIVCTLGAGPLVDRYGARRLMAVFLGPIAAGLVVLATRSETISAFLYLALAGVSSGSSRTIAGAFWAETYGTKHLGSIRAMLSAMFVVATAVAPVSMGALIDRGVSMETIAWLGFAWTILAAGLAAFAVRGAGNRSSA